MGGFDAQFPVSNYGNNNDVERGGMPASSDPTGALKPLNKADEKARMLSTLNGWWHESRDAHAANRAEQHIDADFYDHHQIDAETAAAMAERGQAPLVYNLVKAACDWVIGTERRTRVDWKIHPRGPEDQATAQAKQSAMKYVDDVNNGSFARSAAFTHSVKVGVGWIEECVNLGGDEEPITFRHEDWKVFWWDPFARALDLKDARYIHRAKWMDVDYAISMFPQYKDVIERHARATDDIDLEDCEDVADVPGLFFNRSTHSYDQGVRHGTGSSMGRRLRSRVRLIETWYRKPKKIKRMMSLDPNLDRVIFDKTKREHLLAVGHGTASLYDGMSDETWVCIWVPNMILSMQKSPYKHNRYPFTPSFAYRDDKSGMPYGLIRGMRDAQDDYNKRRAKALFLLSTNRLIYENGAIEAEDEQDFLDEAAAPNAQLRVAAGALTNNRIKFENGADLANSQMALMEQSKLHVFEGNGVTRENLGQDSNAISGRAILAKQQQGAVTTAEIFDNYRFAFRVSGQKGLSLIEQYMTLPKRIRIIGAKGAMDWVMLNEPDEDPVTGEIFFKNDLAKSEADFYVDQQDYRETQRMAMAESLFETLKGMPPEIQLAMLDLAIEMTDLPNREEFVRRIRAMSGQGAPGEDESPEAVLARQQQEAQKQRGQEIEYAEKEAGIRLTHAQATKYETEAKNKNVETQQNALNTAALLAGSVELAPAADRLAEFPTQ